MANFDPSQPFTAVDSPIQQQVTTSFDPSQPFTATSSNQEPGLIDKAKSFVSNLGKSAVEQLPAIGAIAGGITAGAAATPETFGTGTVPAAIGGAALGGGMGKAAENMIKSYFWPDEAPKTPTEAIKSVAGGVATGAMTEIGGQVAGKALDVVASKAASTLGDLSEWLTQKSIPLSTKKLMSRLGGQDGLDTLIQAGQDYHVTNTPGTLRTMQNRYNEAANAVGQELGQSYKALDKAATQTFTGKQAEDMAVQSYKEYLQSKNQTLTDSTEQKMRNTLQDYFKPDAEVTHEEMWKAANTLQGSQFLGDGLPKNFNQSVAISVRNANQHLAEIASTPEMAATTSKLSQTFRALKTASTAMKDKLESAPSIVRTAIKGSKYTAAAEYGGVKGLALAGLSDVATSTTGITAASKAAKIGSDILQYAPQLGNYGKAMIRLAANKGIDAVSSRHAYLMINDSKYRNLYKNITNPSDTSLDQNTGQ